MSRQLKINQDMSQPSPPAGPMMEAGRDLNIYDGTFNLVHGHQIIHNNEGSGRIFYFIPYDTLMTR